MSATFLQDLVIVMVAATAVTILFSRLKQPLVIGYLLVGVLIGPHLLPAGIIQDSARISELAELGLIFLMFALGLEFNFSKVRRHGLVAFFIAFVEVAAMIGFGFALGQFLSWTIVDSLFLGAILASTSTTVLVKVFLELGLIQEEFAEVAIGVTILEDLLVIVVALLLQMNAMHGSIDAGAVGMLLLELALFLAITLSIGIVGVPRFIEWVSRHALDEVLVITVVGLAFAGALAAANLGFSLSLGAFLMGAIVAESRAVRKVESKVVPIRDLFSSLFFVAVGMLLEPRIVLEQWWLVLLLTGVALFGKVVANWAGAMLAGYDGATSLRIGLAMAQMGEWSLIIAAMGLALGTMTEVIYPATVAACSITMLLAPFILRASGPISEALAGLSPSGLSRVLRAYRTVLQRLRSSWAAEGSAELKSRTHAHKVNLVLFGSWIMGLFIAAFALFAWVEGRFGHLLPLAEEARRAVSLAIVGAMGLPLFVPFARAAFGWYTLRSRHVSLRPGSLTRRSVSPLPGRAFASLVALTAALAVPAASVWIATVTVHPLLIPSWPVTTAVILGLGFLAALTWRHLALAGRWLERTLADLLSPPDTRSVSPSLQRIRDRCPWGIEAVEVEVGPWTQAASARVSDAAIRARTGAVVVATVRGGTAVPVRMGQYAASPGERVILVGTLAQVEQARQILQGPDRALHAPAAIARG